MSRRQPFRALDPLYGPIELPAFLEQFLFSPEFARLGNVRLLNCESLELAAASEARRRSHTLGVLHLATRLPLLEFGPEDVQALLYAIVLHDVGTPPFGHTMEYEYIRLLKTDHEEFVRRILDADHHTHGRDHQVSGRPMALHRLIKRTGVEERIRAILSGGHPLSNLLAGDLDLDNIDNVFRMAWYLGMRPDATAAQRLAGAIRPGRDGRNRLEVCHRPLVEEWARLRASAYRALFDSPRHRQAQAVLGAVMAQAFKTTTDAGALLERDDWLKTDEQVMSFLRAQPELAPAFRDLDRPRPLPETSIEFEADASIGRPALMAHRQRLSASLSELDGRLYVTFIPYGEAIERRVAFLDPNTEEDWTVGSPERLYRLHVHYGGARSARGLVALEQKVLGKIEEHAQAARWRIRNGFRAAAT